MPAKNIYHDTVIRALIADGWTITHDPLTLSFGGKELFVDLGAERMTIGADKDDLRIAVEFIAFLVRHRCAIWKKRWDSTLFTVRC